MAISGGVIMVGSLKRYKHDPDGKHRGAGLYYHRGNGEHSKYSPSRDTAHKHTKDKREARKSKNRHKSDTHKSRGGWI